MHHAIRLVCLTMIGAGCTSGAAEARNGCAPGTFSTVQSPDHNAVSFLFDDFSAVSGQSAHTSCKLDIPVSEKPGYSVFAVDYRGFGVKGKRQAISHKSGDEKLFDPKGRFSRDFSISRNIGSTNDSALSLSLLLTAEGRKTDIDPAQIYLDTVDIARIGFVTRAAVSQSLDGLATERLELIEGFASSSQQMLGRGQPFEEDSYLSTFGATDRTIGFNSRWNATDDLTVFGSLAYADPQTSGSDTDGALMLASALRYAVPITSSWRLYGEVGAWGSPNLRATFTRSYVNMNTVVSTEGRSSGSLLNIYSRLGAVYAANDDNELSLSAGLSRSLLTLNGYSENADGNLFAAHINGGQSTLDTADLQLGWTHKINPVLDYTLAASLGHEFANRDAVHANVDWVGDASGGWRARNFGSVSARLGWQVTDSWKLDTTIGVSAYDNARANWQVGAEIKTPF